jgi:two-component system cell cycle sensor histidine kinase/response regulator CckA
MARNRGSARSPGGGVPPDIEVQKLRRAVEASGEAIFITAPDGTFTYVNPAFVALYGFTPEEVVGRATPRVLKSGHLADDHYRAFWDRLLTGETVRDEFTNRTKDGRLVDVEASVSPILDQDQALVGFLAIQRDISARKVSERELRRWADIFRHTAVGVAVVHGASDHLTLANPALASMYGYTLEEMVRLPIRRLFAPDRQDEPADLVRRLKELGQLQVETRHVRADGTVFPVALELTGVFDVHGELLYRVATTIDLTEQHEARQALADNETKYRTLYASMREGVALHELIFDADGQATDYRVLDVNPAFELHTGVPAGRAVGALGSNLYGGGQAPFLEIYARVAATGEATTFESGVDRLGRVFRVSAFSLARGRFATVFEDVTERRQLEEQFRQAQKMEAIGRLAGGIAHDFNNLLTAILGYSELLLQQDLGEAVKDDVTQIRKAGEAAAGLTRQLLAFSRKQVLRPELVDLNDVAKDNDTMLRRVIGEDVTLVSIPAPGLWRVSADPGQLQQVLLNLSVNARDAMPSGGSLIIETANVTISREPVGAGSPPAGQYVSLIVSDTGTGMSKEVQTRLFEPFFTTKEKGKGTGLGLSTVYGIVKQSEGHIVVQSEEGRGTTFRILLPRAQAAPSAVTVAVEPVATAGRETVLVVEDQLPVRTLIGKILGASGYRVLAAGDAEEAERLAAAEEQIDLLLTDVLLGTVNGPELAQRLVSVRPGLRVLYISGYADQATLLGVLSSRIAFLHKPFTPETLAQKVRQVLDADAS